MTTACIRPPIQERGGKFSLAQRIASAFPAASAYNNCSVEPFGKPVEEEESVS